MPRATRRRPTFPLVAHRGTPDAKQGATVYLAYTLAGGAALLTGIVWLESLTHPTGFTHRGFVAGLPAGH